MGFGLRQKLVSAILQWADGTDAGTFTHPIRTKPVDTSPVQLVDDQGVPLDTVNGALSVSGAGGGGGAVTEADGANVALGAKADAAATDSTSAWSAVALLKGLLKAAVDVWNGANHYLSVFQALSATNAKETDCSASGDNTIHTPASGKAIQLCYLCLSAAGGNTADVTALVKFGAGPARYKVSLKAGAMWARNIGAGRFQLAGGANEDLIVNLSAAQTVFASIEYSEV